MNKVSVGLGTIIGLVLTTAGSAATAWAAAEGPSSHVSPGLLAVLTVVSGGFTALGRMYQAAQAPVPVEALTDAPETAVKPDTAV